MSWQSLFLEFSGAPGGAHVEPTDLGAHSLLYYKDLLSAMYTLVRIKAIKPFL